MSIHVPIGFKDLSTWKAKWQGEGATEIKKSSIRCFFSPKVTLVKVGAGQNRDLELLPMWMAGFQELERLPLVCQAHWEGVGSETEQPWLIHMLVCDASKSCGLLDILKINKLKLQSYILHKKQSICKGLGQVISSSILYAILTHLFPSNLEPVSHNLISICRNTKVCLVFSSLWHPPGSDALEFTWFACWHY